MLINDDNDYVGVFNKNVLVFLGVFMLVIFLIPLERIFHRQSFQFKFCALQTLCN